ncbi:hypothetical protein ZWY2020_024735 [Hordeum vulgare]|nr:hypothetical protein ZWY2020_024735 [Hordeum vulgare]
MASASSSARDTGEGWRDGGSIDDGGAEVVLCLRLRTGTSGGSSSAARKSMTIFYAREIITMVSQHIVTEQQDSGGGTPMATQRHAPLLASRPLLHGLGAAAITSHAPAAGLSMKRLLQQFLQKQKMRVTAMGSPYARGRPVMPS